MKLMAIDPGTVKSAYVLYVPDKRKILKFGIEENTKLVKMLEGDRLAIEMIKSYGNVMGDTTIITCVWIGRFIQAWGDAPIDLVPRKSIVTSLCNSPRGRDANVRAALVDRFTAYSGASQGQVTKKGGVLYGVKKDIWSALALAEVWQEIRDDMLR